MCCDFLAALHPDGQAGRRCLVKQIWSLCSTTWVWCFTLQPASLLFLRSNGCFCSCFLSSFLSFFSSEDELLDDELLDEESSELELDESELDEDELEDELDESELLDEELEESSSNFLLQC